VIDFVRRNPILTAALGMVVAGVIAGLASASGSVPTSYAIVAGLAAATPPLNLGRGGASFERERYLSADNRREVLVDSVVSGVAAFLLGAGAVLAAASAGIEGGTLTVVLAAGGTALGGQVAFFFRTVEYRSIEGRDDEEGDEESESDE
jgi:hypothetical protein